MVTDDFSPGLAVYRKLHLLMAKVNHLDKTGRNDHFSYKFVEADVITAACRAAMLELRLVLNCDIVSMTQSVVDEKKPAGVRTDLEIAFTWVDIDTGDFLVKNWMSEAMDTQDKGINKALTAAVKYFLLKELLIPSGDLDPDSDAGDKTSGASQPSQPTGQYKQKPAVVIVPVAANLPTVEDAAAVHTPKGTPMGRLTQEQLVKVIKSTDSKLTQEMKLAAQALLVEAEKQASSKS
jgi:hypothetical protein